MAKNEVGFNELFAPVMVPLLTLASLIPFLPSFPVLFHGGTDEAAGVKPKFSQSEVNIIYNLDMIRMALVILPAAFTIVSQSHPEFPMAGIYLQAVIGYILSASVTARLFTFPGKSSV